MIQHGQETVRMLVLGVSGSGKTHFVRHDVIPAISRKCRYMVFLNNSGELADLVAPGAHYEIGDDNANVDFDLKALIKTKRRVSFEVLAMNPEKFLDQLAKAVYELGEVCLIMDEAHEWLGWNDARPAMIRLYKSGRKRGVHLVAITQTFQRGPASGLHIEVRKQTNIVVSFRVVDTDADVVGNILAGIDPSQLRPYEAHTGERPEYVVSDQKSGTVVKTGREGHKTIRA